MELNNATAVATVETVSEVIPKSEAEGRRDAGDTAGRMPALQKPRWQEISGLTPEAEGKMSRSERRYALRKLYRKFDELAREALAEHEGDAEKDERSYLWDPVAMICVELGIARCKLSALTRELTGMSAHDIVDRARAEKIKTQLEDNVARDCRRCVTPGYRLENGSWFEFLLKEFRTCRRNDGFDSAQWALQHGFSNYARFRRGCMLAHGGKSPQAIERDAMGEIADYYWLADELSGRSRENAPIYFKLRAENAGLPRIDEWAKALRERGEWLARMKAKLGLKRELEEVSTQTHHPVLDEEQKAYLARVEAQKIEDEGKEKAREDARRKAQEEADRS